jgi:tripartite-type tricarboxylate transporter receptor subunit TctC
MSLAQFHGNGDIMQRIATLVVAGAAALAPAMAEAQAYPVKPIRLVVPFSPGGGVDVTARLITQRMQASMGQPFVIDNRGGAAGQIGEELVSKAPADGYNLLYAVGSDMSLRQFLSRNAQLDPIKDFTPIATAIGTVSVVVGGPATPAGNLKDLIAYAKKNPGKLTYGSAGVASYQHLIGEFLKQQHGIDMVHVPFKGLAPALQAVVAGQIDVSINNFATSISQINAGKAKALAVLEPRRYEAAPNVPTLAEEVPGFSMPSPWFGFFGPAGLPQPIVARLNAEVSRAVESPEVAPRLRELYVRTMHTAPADMPALIAATTEAFGRIIKAAGIKPLD